MDAVDGQLVTGLVEWLIGVILQDVRFKPADHGRDVVIDGMLRRTAGKSVRYAGEQVVPEPLDAVW